MPKTLWGYSKRFAPLLILIVLIIAVYASGITDILSFASLKKHRLSLLQFVENHAVLAPVIYILCYIAITALSIPVAALFTIAGGFLFPLPLSTLYVVIGATIGATCIFLIAKTAIGDFLRKRAGKMIAKMEKGFEEHAISYMLFLRFIPVFPFWLVNLAPALFGVKLRDFIWTTFVGIIPGSYVFTQAGSGLGAIFESGKTFSLDNVLNTQIKIALVLLAIFALLPIVIKKIIKKKHD